MEGFDGKPHALPIAYELEGVGYEEAKRIVGSALRRMRQESGITARELGARLDPPVTESAVTSWERGRTTPGWQSRDQIEGVLGDVLEGHRRHEEIYLVSRDPSPERGAAEKALIAEVPRLSVAGLVKLTEHAQLLELRYPNDGGEGAGQREP